jgi:hypothetical protein
MTSHSDSLKTKISDLQIIDCMEANDYPLASGDTNGKKRMGHIIDYICKKTGLKEVQVDNIFAEYFVEQKYSDTKSSDLQSFFGPIFNQ